MKRVCFFTCSHWAFGSIHSILSKELYHYGILADILDWALSYPSYYVDNMIKLYDFFVTTPSEIDSLMSYGVPINKIILIAHGEVDLYTAMDRISETFYDVYDYAVVSEGLIKTSSELGIKRIPKLLRVGINYKNFYESKLPNELKRIGYPASFDAKNYRKQDIKRGRLVKKVCEITGTEFVTTNCKFNHFGMPQFYKEVDCIIQSSVEETVGLPVLEGSAAGRLVMGTAVGMLGLHKHGDILPLREKDFMEKTVEKVREYQANPELFQSKCKQIQEYASVHFDWKNFIDDWAKLFL